MRTASQWRRDASMHLSRRLNMGLAPPDRVSVNLTLRCNLSCTMCTTCYDSPELSTDEVKGIIDQAASWGVKVFNPLGGEPFIRADLEEILSHAVDRGFYVTITTNGTLITAARAAMLATLPPDRLHINISLDGDREANDLIRSKGAWQRAVDGFAHLRAADAAAGNSRRKILTNTILHRHNLARFEAILDEQAALGFDGVQILNLFRSDDEAKGASLAFRREDEPALDALVERLIARVAAQGDVGHHIQNSVEELRLIPRHHRGELTPLDAPCWAGWKELYINADGQAIMCDGQLDFLAGAFGSVRDKTLRQLWRSPELKARRAVVKQCTTPCIQKCYLRTESDSALELLKDGGIRIAKQLGERLGQPLRKTSHHPDATLRLELSDTCPCDWAGCDTPATRWTKLTQDLPRTPEATTWGELRDLGHLDFGRGFMGFDVVRSVVADLQRQRLRFGTLDLGWRGEPLLHPEFGPILRFLQEATRAGLVDRLRIPTDGRFLTEELAALAATPVAQDWVLDLDRGPSTGAFDLLSAHAGPATRIIVATTATEESDPAALRARFPRLRVVAGRFPAPALSGPILWIRRSDHDNFQANALARKALAQVADALGVEAELGEEDQPRRCCAPDRSPTVSWDGKITLCPADRRLDNVVGSVITSQLSAVWQGPELTADRAMVTSRGVPARDLCRDCPMPWSPNLPG